MPGCGSCRGVRPQRQAPGDLGIAGQADVVHRSGGRRERRLRGRLRATASCCATINPASWPGRIGEKNKERNVPGLIVPSPYLDVKLARDGLLRVNNTGRHRVEAYTPERRPGVLLGQAVGGHRRLLRLLQPDRPGAAAGRALCDLREGTAAGEGLLGTTGSSNRSWPGRNPSPRTPRRASSRRRADCLLGGLDAAVDSQQRIYILDLVANDVRVMKRKA